MTLDLRDLGPPTGFIISREGLFGDHAACRKVTVSLTICALIYLIPQVRSSIRIKVLTAQSALHCNMVHNISANVQKYNTPLYLEYLFQLC